MKKIIISIAAGFATLSLGLAIFYAGEFLVSIFQTQKVEKQEFDYNSEHLIFKTLAKKLDLCANTEIQTYFFVISSKENSLYDGDTQQTEESLITNDESIEFDRIYVVNQQITFQTQTKNGISYQFTGKFTNKKEIEIGEYIRYSVLEGKLTKIKNSKKIAVTAVNFEYLHQC